MKRLQCVVASAIMVGLGHAAHATVRHVPSQYLTIQAAIDDCIDGDTVVVANNTYSGLGNVNLDFKGLDIVVRSSGGAGNCIIDCLNTPGTRGVKFVTSEPSSAMLIGFTIRNGNMTGSSTGDDGGGVLVHSGNPVIYQCVIENCVASTGGGVAVLSGSVVLFDCVVRGNIADGNDLNGAMGGGVNLRATLPSWVVRTRIENNSAVSVFSTSGPNGAFGGGLSASGPVGVTVRACTIRNNTSDSSAALASYCYAGGIQAATSGLTKIEGCSITGNRALHSNGYGGGVVASGNTVISQSLIESNTAVAVGGGIFPNMGPVTVRQCIVRLNSAPRGGGIGANFSPGSLTVASTLITDNTATFGGGAFLDVNARYSSCTIARNIATTSGGGIYVASPGCQLDNSIVWANTAPSGRDVFSVALSTGALAATNSDLPLSIPGSVGPMTRTGCIDANPLFFNPLGPDLLAGTGDDNFRLASGSPCIDSGSNSQIPGGILWDLDQRGRRGNDPLAPDVGTGLAPIVDMGAYERFGELPWARSSRTATPAAN